MRSRRRFTREFKVEAAKLVTERGVTVAQAGRDLDIHVNSLRAWVERSSSNRVIPCIAGPAARPYSIRAARKGSPRASVARAKNPVTFATAKDTPDRFRSRGTFGMGLGNGAAVYDGRSSVRGSTSISLRSKPALDTTPITPLRLPGSQVAPFHSRADTTSAPCAAAYATTGASFSACAGFVVPRLRLIKCAPWSAAH